MKREDGRKFFYQWELGQRLIVDEACTVVHFANGTTKEALCVKVVNGRVNVPNILLQTAADLHCYAWDGTTVVAKTTFQVEARPRPAEYVYTETEVLSYELLDAELEALVKKFAEQEKAIEKVAEKIVGKATEEGGVVFNDHENNEAGEFAAAFGSETKASGKAAFAGGLKKSASGDYSGAVPDYAYRHNEAIGEASMAMGMGAVAYSRASKSLGYRTQTGYPPSAEEAEKRTHYVDSEGITVAKGTAGATAVVEVVVQTNAEGNITYPEDNVGQAAFAIGSDTAAVGNNSFAGGYRTQALASQAFATGQGTRAVGKKSFTAGYLTEASGENAFAAGQETKASGDNSHAEGHKTTASGLRSHTEGNLTVASAVNSHAEGTESKALGNSSHAEGGLTEAHGHHSHTEGYHTIAYASHSHAEGYETVVSGERAHAEGNQTTASGANSHAEGVLSESAGDRSHAEGDSTQASGYASHTEGYKTVAGGEYSHAEGNNTTASGQNSHAEGVGTIATNAGAHAEGYATTASGNYSHAEGSDTTASGSRAHAEGYSTSASGNYSHTEGYATTANGSQSHAEGLNTIASSPRQHVQGKYNEEDAEGTYAHIVGGGDSSTNRSNIHTLDWKGNAWLQGTMTTNGADYAEFFEWADGNPNNEDRVGYLVALDGEKIKLASEGDDVIGVISGTAAVLGDNSGDVWKKKYLTDDFGRIIYDMVEEFDTEIDPETNEEVQVSIGVYPHPRINPDFDSSVVYVPREERQEWDKVGMLGKLYVRDDGTCVVGGYGCVGENGILTYSQERTNIRVMKRINDNIVLVLMK